MKSRPRLGVALSRAHYAFVAFLEAHLEACGLAGLVRPGMGHVLYELLEEDDLTLSELSARARVAQSTMTGIVTKMEAAGLLHRSRDARDGRAFRLRLTPKARALRPRMRDLERLNNRAYAAMFSPREMTTLVGLLERLRSALSAGRRAPAGRSPRGATA